MTKTEAIAEMRKGVKVTHQYFSPEEWMTMKGNIIILEDGVQCDENEFWQWRNNKSWEDGYSIFKQY